MKLTEPLRFEPLFMERVWGGRQLETLFGKALPCGVPIGESWELVDREEAQSVVHSGLLRGKTLHELWTDHREEIFGRGLDGAARFPLLFKLLDARERLSVQVHPPAQVAERLAGEPKTEMWYVADTYGESEIFAGLKKGVTRESFESALQSGEVAQKIHAISVKPGDAIFIPSGRIHAIGAGNVIVEVQQNSDTTYRVFDWNRVGLDGKPRELHVEESFESIDFKDVEPSVQRIRGKLLAECEYFRVEKWELTAGRACGSVGEFAVMTCLHGTVECGKVQFAPGDFFVVQASLEEREIRPLSGSATVLRTTIPR